MKHLYFVRHGMSELGKQGLWAGSTNTPLATEGRDQAKAAGISARQLHIDHIICSPMIRARDTASLIAAEIGYPDKNIEINELTIERDYGDLEGTIWDPELDINSISSAESAESIIKRAEKTYKYLQMIQSDNVLLVSHGTFGRALRHVIHPEIPFDKSERFENAKIVPLL